MDVMEPDVSTQPVAPMTDAAEAFAEPAPSQEAAPPTAPVELGPELGGDASIEELDKMIGELQEARDYLQAEGERIEREAVGYTELSQTALESVRIISDTVSEWRKAGHPVRHGTRT
jgi:hypothetical protein